MTLWGNQMNNKELTDEQVLQECFNIAFENGYKKGAFIKVFAYADLLVDIEWDKGKGKTVVLDTNIYELLYNTSNGFAKALFGEEDKVDCPEGRRMGWRWHLSEMVGQNPIEYLRKWLKDRR